MAVDPTLTGQPVVRDQSLGSRSELRREMRHRRRSVPGSARRRAAQGLASHLGRSGLVRRSHRIATYLPNDGEMDPRPLIRRLWAMGKACYLPVLRDQRLWFLPYDSHTRLSPNRFGILEPVLEPNRRWPLRTLDLVLAPLVAFDQSGNRLGMGGGFYDRSFAYLRSRSHWRRPIIVGAAFEFQAVAELDYHPWDVPLHGVVTEFGLRWFTPITGSSHGPGFAD